MVGLNKEDLPVKQRVFLKQVGGVRGMIWAIVLGIMPLLAAPVDTILPRAGFLPNWTYESEPTIYTPDSLFKYINGEAELYNSYTFEKMATAIYTSRQNDEHTCTVDVYDMGSPLDAFGVYSNFRSQEARYGDIGQEAILSEYTIRFYKGNYYVNLNTVSKQDTMQQIMTKLAKNIAAKIDNTPQPPELNYLFSTQRLDHSLKFLRHGFLGQKAFDNSLQAVYLIDGEPITGFVVINDTHAQALQDLDAFKASVQRRGEMTRKLNNGVIASLPHQGEVMIGVHSRFLFGVMDYKQKPSANLLYSGIQKYLAHLENQ